jgi:hypothetical protein
MMRCCSALLRSAILIAFFGDRKPCIRQCCRCRGSLILASRVHFAAILPLQDSRTPLHWAASMGHLDVVTYLLANGAEVDKADDGGWTALHNSGRRAIPAQFYFSFFFLAERGVSILVSAGQEDVVRELVGAGAEVNRKNDKGITPLFVSFPRVPCRTSVFLTCCVTP